MVDIFFASFFKNPLFDSFFDLIMSDIDSFPNPGVLVVMDFLTLFLTLNSGDALAPPASPLYTPLCLKSHTDLIIFCGAIHSILLSSQK